MKRFPRSRLSSLSLCVAVGLASSACVKPDAPTVGMSKVEASLVFGVRDIPEAVASPIEQVVEQFVAAAAPPAVQARREAAAPPEEPEESPFEFTRPTTPRFATQTPANAKSACPEAPVTAAPLLSPQPRISGDARPGITKWRLTGFLTTKNFETQAPQQTDLDGLGSPRLIRNVTKINDSVFTFEEVEVSNDTVTVTTYRVNDEPVVVSPTDGVGIVAAPGVGEPERGVVIKSIRTSSKQTGQLVYEFAPAGAGLLVLPLPATAGERFTSTAVDARSGQVISHDATVQERQRVDACGELIDGWGVEYNRRQTVEEEFGATAATAEVFYATVFATQYGGIPILQRIKLTAGQCFRSCPLDITERVAHVDPQPSTP